MAKTKTSINKNKSVNKALVMVGILALTIKPNTSFADHLEPKKVK